MNTNVDTATVAVERVPSRVMDFVILAKPELSLLSLLTTLAGFFAAARGGVDYLLLVSTLVGTALLAAGAAALNMYIERSYDALMRRTARRPIPAGRIRPSEALAFGVGTAVVGTAVLLAAVNVLTAALGVATFASYLFVYTPLKRRTTWNTLIGCVPGAIPPMMGWTAVRNDLPIEAWSLFLILFVWQMPHFLALAWMYRQDYKRGGFRMLPTEEESGRATARNIVFYCALLVPVGVAPAFLGMSGTIYAATALALGVAFLALGVALARRRTNALARRLFFASLVYIPVLFAALMLDKG